ncbi:MAG: hypothetical protein ACYDA0_10170 [Candidatus Dormibacteraceae bacterium]
MRSNRAILWVSRMPASAAIGETVGDFLRYIHYRDEIQRGEEGRGVAGLVRYVAHRDQASPQGRLFTRDRVIGDRERHALVRFVRRSLEGVPAHLMDQQRNRLPAFYRFVFSPEDVRGLDLRQLTREIMRQLERDAGEIPPWIAAEHRNTAHPHIHIGMAARREVAPGEFRGLQVSRERLARMKATMSLEIERQRGDRQPGVPLQAGLLDVGSRPFGERTRGQSRRVPAPVRAQLARHDPLRWQRPSAPRHRHSGPSWYPIQGAFARLAAHYRREMEREEREAMRRWRLSDRERGEEREREVYE